MVPVTVYGFNGLKERIESQKQVLKSFTDSDTLQQVITSSHTMITECDRLARECDEKQSKLEEQMIRVLGKIESTSTNSQVIVTNEEFMQKLVKLQREVSQATYPLIFILKIYFILFGSVNGQNGSAGSLIHGVQRVEHVRFADARGVVEGREFR